MAALALLICLTSCFSLCQAQTGPSTTICPTTVSTNTDCGFIITIGPGGTITGAAVPNAQPYDGSDDTLVGVVNNSGKTYTGSIIISASAFGTGIFALEGDGICFYIGPGGFQPSPMGAYCSANDVSGIDPGDYEGPIAKFSNITSKSAFDDTGTVTITGLASGASTFFSLEGPPAAIQASGGITLPLQATPANLGQVTLGSSISGSITVNGGTPPYTYATVGTPPQGITVSGATVSGTPTQTGTFSVNITVTDATHATATAAVTYTVVPQSLMVTGANLGTFNLGASISGGITVTGGTPPYTYATSGTIPQGVTVTGGMISGAPTQAGTFDIAFTVTDSAHATGTASLTFTVVQPAPALMVTGMNLGTINLGASVSGSVSATGGTPPYAFTTNGTVPQGITVNGGMVAGTPTQAGTFSVSITATDHAGASGTASVTYTVVKPAPPPLVVSGVNLGTVGLGSSISGSVTVTGGTPPYTYAAAGPLPQGINVNGNTVSGAATQSGTFSVAVSVTDSAGVSGTASVTFSVFGLTATSLPSGVTYSPYSTQIPIGGGTPPYTYSVSGLPQGLTASSSGLIQGTVTSTVTANLSVTVTDASGAAASGTLSLAFNAPAPLSVPTQTLPAGQISVAYSQAVSVNGGAQPYTFALASGSVPGGLLFRPTGVVSGVPSQIGTVTFGVRVTDVTGASAVGSVTLAISPAPITVTVGPTNPGPAPSGPSSPSGPSVTGSLAGGMADVEYPSQTISAAGGIPPYTFTVTSGNLPPGVTLDSSGTLSGTPTSSGSYTFTITATDSSGAAIGSDLPGALQPRAQTAANTGTATFTVQVRPFGTDILLNTGDLSFSLIAGTTVVPPSQVIGIQSTVTTSPINYSVTTSGGNWFGVTPASGTTPGALTVSLNSQALALAASQTPYQGTITVNCTSCASGSQSLHVTLMVTNPPPALSVSNAIVAFTTLAGAAAPTSQSLGLQDSGGGSIGIASITCAASWCSATSVPGVITPGPGANVNVNVDPTGLVSGFYRTTLTIKASTGVTIVPVTLFIANAASMSLSPSGSLFQSITGGVPNGGDTDFLVDVNNSTPQNWTATVISGANWLTLTKSSGSASASQPGTCAFAIDPVVAAGLAPQAYYGTIRVTIPGLVNSPQDFQVVLNVAPANTPQRPNPSPAGMLFISNAGSTPPPQTVTVTTNASASAGFQVATATNDGAAWLSATPNTGTAGPNAPATTQVSVDPSKLSPGVYYGGVSYAFSGAAIRTVNVTLIVTSAVAQARQVSHAASCSPTQLVPAQTGLLSNFAAPIAWPTPIQIQLLDDCANAVTNGQVVATFSNGDPALSLSLADRSSGLYSGTWTPRHASSQVSVTAKVSAPGLPAVTALLAGSVTPNAAPLLTPDGTLNIYNPLSGGALAPGTLVHIAGSGLAGVSQSSSATTLPTNLNGTQAVVGGMLVPLSQVSPTQLTAQLPFELQPAMQYQLVVSANGALTTPITLQLAPTSPGVAADSAGRVIATHVDGSAVSETSPAKPGEFIVLTGAGLGATDATVSDGAPGPSSPLANALSQPSVTINGENAMVNFAGLQPGVIGMYQVNVQVPADAPDGDLTLVLSQDGNPANSTVLPVKKGS